VDQFDSGIGISEPGELGLKACFVSDKEELGESIILPEGHYGSLHKVSGGVIASHGIECDSHDGDIQKNGQKLTAKGSLG
jgi:hypothetical protein